MEKGSLYGDDCRPMLLRNEDSIMLDTLEDWVAAEQRVAGAQL